MALAVGSLLRVSNNKLRQVKIIYTARLGLESPFDPAVRANIMWSMSVMRKNPCIGS